MKNVVLISLIWLLLGSIGYSESRNTLNGKVICENKGVPYLSVQVKGTLNGAMTDENGNFEISDIPNEAFELIVGGLGYKTVVKEFNQLTIENEDLVIIVEPEVFLLNEIVVSGSRVGVLKYLPGSVNFITSKGLTDTSPVSANEILRSVPGVHVVDEEGAGLRINVGIRGLDPDKSRNVLMLEDGIPVALAPYGEPEMYYSPNIERMAGMEVLKGSGSILFGPQTIGGVVNYITADPDNNPSGVFFVKQGDYGYNSTFAQVGNTINNFGFIANYNRKQANNLGPTRFRLHDLNTKFLVGLSPKSRLTVKLSFYDEDSNSTYVGITQAMYDAGGTDFLRIAPHDNFKVRRYAASGSYKHTVGASLQLTHTLFAYTTTRNWSRQDFSYSSNASNLTGVIHGDPTKPQGAIYMRNSTGNRNRHFEVVGIESRMEKAYSIFGYNSKLDAGARFLHERAFEQRVNGTRAGVVSGILQEDEFRMGNAISAFVQNKTVIHQKLTLTAGIRMENIFYEREIYRLNNRDTLLSNTTKDLAIIPGIGINYSTSTNLNFFGGIHKGYAPPRTKDAISNTGVDLELEAQESWNLELGMRARIAKAAIDFTAFYTEFSNQVIPVSESSGGAGAGLINGGATLNKGAEIMITLPVLNMGNWQNTLVLAGTYVDARFNNDRYVLQKTPKNSSLINVYANVNGNKVPYAPNVSLQGSLLVQHSDRFGLKLSGSYIGEQFTDALNTINVSDWIGTQASDPSYNYVQATMNGRIGLLDAYFLADVSTWYKIGSTGLELNLTVKNLFDQRYIASRRPQGIKVGLPRFVIGGVSYKF